MRIEADNIHRGWRMLLAAVMHCGRNTTITGSVNAAETKELIGTSLHIRDLRSCVMSDPKRDLNYRFMIAEWLWIAAGHNDVETISRYNRQIANWSDDGQRFVGAYGPRLVQQWSYVLETLRQDKFSRQAVVSIWTPNPGKSKDIPCTINAQFFIRENALHSVWTMRSNDLWLGLPHDFFNFAQLTNGLAGELGIDTGGLTLNTGSSHVYSRNYEQVLAILNDAKNIDLYNRVKLLDRFPKASLILHDAAHGTSDAAERSLNDIEEFFVWALSSPNKATAYNILKASCCEY